MVRDWMPGGVAGDRTADIETGQEFAGIAYDVTEVAVLSPMIMSHFTSRDYAAFFFAGAPPLVLVVMTHFLQ